MNELLQEKQLLERGLKRERGRLLKRLRKNEADLTIASSWETLQHEALLLQSNFYRLKKGMSAVVVPDWEREGKEIEIRLDPTLDPEEDLRKRFVKARKLKKSIPYIQKYREENQKAIEACDKALQEISAAQSSEELKKFHKKAPVSKTDQPVKTLPYREYTSESGLKIWVGKSAAKNDQLTFVYARGLDWWLHVSGFSGSHVVIRSTDPDPETLQDAIQLALHYSKAKLEGRADVCVTQKKYVARLKQPGQVQISKHRIVHAKLDPVRFENLKKRCVAF